MKNEMRILRGTERSKVRAMSWIQQIDRNSAKDLMLLMLLLLLCKQLCRRLRRVVPAVKSLDDQVSLSTASRTPRF